MARTASHMVPLGTPAPEFTLPDTTAGGADVSLADYGDAPAMLVMFICNHCPFVQHLRHELARFVREYQERGLAAVAISSNDADKYPDDAPEAMAAEAQANGYTFPYLYDETQEVAKEYRATCTPDFFLYDRERELVYRGQFDDSRPGNGLPVTGADLARAVEAALAGEPVPAEQKPSIGCNIKWKKGNAPDYAAG